MPSLVVSGGAGAIAGYVIGYALKKFLKLFLEIIAVVLGLIMTALYLGISWLESNGILTITYTFNQDKFNAVLESALTWTTGQVGSLVTTISAIANASIGTLGVLGGIALGFSKG